MVGINCTRRKYQTLNREKSIFSRSSRDKCLFPDIRLFAVDMLGQGGGEGREGCWRDGFQDDLPFKENIFQ